MKKENCETRGACDKIVNPATVMMLFASAFTLFQNNENKAQKNLS